MRSAEEGNAVVEFVGIVIAVMLPLALIAGSCWSLVVNQLALHSAVHGASRAFVLSPSTAVANTRVRAVTAATETRYGLVPRSIAVTVTCSAADCLVPGAYVTIRGARTVSLAVPVVGRWTVTVRAADTAVVDLAR